MPVQRFALSDHDFLAAQWPTAPHRRHLVFIHGAGQSAEIWLQQLEGLGDCANPMALDLPGHGASSRPGMRSVKDYAGYILRFMEDLGLDDVVLCGHSMGGAITQTLLVQACQRIRSAVLINTGARLRVHEDILREALADYEAFLDLVFQVGFAPENQSSALRATFKSLCTARPEVAWQDYQACNGFDMMNVIDAIKVPVLVIASDKDQLTPLKYGTYLAEHIPRAQLRVISGAGHHAALEKPAHVTQAILDFIQQTV